MIWILLSLLRFFFCVFGDCWLAKLSSAFWFCGGNLSSVKLPPCGSVEFDPGVHAVPIPYREELTEHNSQGAVSAYAGSA